MQQMDAINNKLKNAKQHLSLLLSENIANFYV